MKIAKVFLISFFIGIQSVFSLSLSNQLMAQSGKPLFAVDSDIGQLEQVKSGSIEEKAVQAVETPYDNQWMESYVDASLFYGFAHAFSQTLIQTLPLVQPLRVASQQSSNQEVVVKIKDKNNTLMVVTFDHADPQKAKIVTIEVKKSDVSVS